MANVENQTFTGDRRGNALGAVVTKKIKQRFERVLAGFQDGQLSLTWPDGTSAVYGTRSSKTENNANVVLHSYLPLRRLITDGQLGFAESYMQGEWSTEHLPNLFSLIMRNEANIGPATRGGRFSRAMNIWQHRKKRNSIGGSQRNIAYHYDLGNDFYRLWLDQSMSYSSALYLRDNDSLTKAQQNKIDRITRMLAPEAGANIVEIGCGWGGLAHHLAQNAHVNITGVSLSKEQLEYANAHNKVTSDCSKVSDVLNTDQSNALNINVNNSDAGSVPSPGSSSFEYCDYRDIDGKFDHIVSVEMFEAVGKQYWETYFNKLSSLLDSGGTAVIQTITLAENRFDAYLARPDFIQRYIFPGGMLPTKPLLTKLVEQAGFELEQAHWFGESYAKTLAAWREKFELASKEVLALNFDERFLRMWRYYLVYCETGFQIGHTDVGLLKIRKL